MRATWPGTWRSYQWLLQGKDFQSIHPSLQRQAVLNMAYGLYEVVPGRIYQVRGFDLANISFIKGDTGWIVFDPLTAKETARAALAFINEKLGKRPVLGVVYSHSHVDHFGGVRGVVDEADVISGKVKVIAPEGFMQAAIEENVFSGNAMSRRTQYSYAVLLPRDPYGHADQSIGKNVANGNVGLIAPNLIIKKDFEEVTIDGVKMVFQNTPDTEAPVEMNTYFPQFKAFWAAENVTGTIHNIYTPRGAPVRNALNWSKQINVALYRFGQEAEVMFASHSWPRWGNARIQEVLRTQRDTYANLNNQSLHYANLGVTINEIQNVYQLPPSLWKQWPAHSYHGSEQHNSRGVINRFLGYWDGNPVNIAPLSPTDSAPLYVEMMGGSDKIMAKGRELIGQGKYNEASEILNKLVFAQPGNQAAKDLLADAFEQLGYQKESPTLRNIFLQGAYELRNGLPGGTPARSSGPDMIRAMSTENWLDFIGISVDPRKAEGMKLRHQPGHARQRREVPGGDEQRDAHQHQGRAGEVPRSHDHAQPQRSQPGDDGPELVRRPDRGRQGEVRGRSQAFRPAPGNPGRVRPEFRDHAGNGREDAGEGSQAVRNARYRAAGCGGRLKAPLQREPSRISPTRSSAKRRLRCESRETMSASNWKHAVATLAIAVGSLASNTAGRRRHQPLRGRHGGRRLGVGGLFGARAGRLDGLHQSCGHDSAYRRPAHAGRPDALRRPGVFDRAGNHASARQQCRRKSRRLVPRRRLLLFA